MTIKQAAKASLDSRWELPKYSMGFELIWQWIACWLFGHIMDSKSVLKSKGAVSTNYWCIRCGYAYGITSGILGAIPYGHIAIIINSQSHLQRPMPSVNG